MTEDQIEELRELQKELRAQAEAVTDAWDDWANSWDPVSEAIHKYNEILKEVRDIAGDPLGEFGDLDTEIDIKGFKFGEADAIEDAIEEILKDEPNG